MHKLAVIRSMQDSDVQIDIVPRLLEMFDQADVTATFFVLGWVAERHPELIRRMVREGHELASHGYDHTRATQGQPIRSSLWIATSRACWRHSRMPGIVMMWTY